MAPTSQGLIFGIGVNKSGTHSLKDALNLLGWRTLHHSFLVEETMRQERTYGWPLLSTWIGRFGAFLDYPIPRIYAELDQLYPGGKFIQTTRPLDDWISSRISHIERDRQLLAEGKISYGWVEEIRPKQWIAEYERHHEMVARYFNNRAGDLLVLNICEGEGWDKLCPFLKAEPPVVPFPHSNRRGEQPDRDSALSPHGAIQ